MNDKVCYRCGNRDVLDLVLDDGDSAVCDTCEKDYQAFLDVQYPHGQCQTCGATYAVFTCHLGKQHVDAVHAEGACGLWADAEPLPDDARALGYCDYGCKPMPVARVLRPDRPLDPATLPF